MKGKKNSEWLQDMIGELEDELLLETEELRNRKILKKYQKKAFLCKKKNVSKKFVKQPFLEQLKENQTIQAFENKKKRNTIWKTIGTLVACVSVFLIGNVCWKMVGFENYVKDSVQNETHQTELEKQEALQGEEQEVAEAQQNADSNLFEPIIEDTSDIMNQQTDIRQTTEQLKELEIIENRTQGDILGEDGHESEHYVESLQNENAHFSVYIPQREVSLASTNGLCMKLFFIYQDRVYVHYETLYKSKLPVGKCLGTTTGLIDVWTKKDGYVNFAGSVIGDFYEVNGYESEFMLCMPMENGDIWVFINDNDLHLQEGADIFEKFLHLGEKSYTAFYMTNEVWNNEKSYEEKKVAVNTDDYKKVKQLLNEINNGTVVLTKDIWNDCGLDTFYNEKQLYHLYLEMDDGMFIHLRIFEEGYVMFDGLSDVCVKVEM